MDQPSDQLTKKLATIEDKYNKRRTAITARRALHIHKGRFFVDVCAETHDAIIELQNWWVKKTQLAKDQDFMRRVAQDVGHETLTRVQQFFFETKPTTMPNWARLIPSIVRKDSMNKSTSLST
jgi:hypothetical protein